MRIRRGPATVTGGSRPHAPRRASHWARTRAREGAGGEARKPGDLPPTTQADTPSWKGVAHVADVSAVLARRRCLLARLPRSRRGAGDVDVRVEGMSATSSARTRRRRRPRVDKDGEHRCAGTSAAGALERATGGSTGAAATRRARSVERILGEAHRSAAQRLLRASGSTTSTRERRRLRHERQAGDDVLCSSHAATSRLAPRPSEERDAAAGAERPASGHAGRRSRSRSTSSVTRWHDDDAGAGRRRDAYRRRRAARTTDAAGARDASRSRRRAGRRCARRARDNRLRRPPRRACVGAEPVATASAARRRRPRSPHATAAPASRSAASPRQRFARARAARAARQGRAPTRRASRRQAAADAHATAGAAAYVQRASARLRRAATLRRGARPLVHRRRPRRLVLPAPAPLPRGRYVLDVDAHRQAVQPRRHAPRAAQPHRVPRR